MDKNPPAKKKKKKKNPPAKAGDTSLIPRQGRCLAGQQSSCATTTETAHLEPGLHNKRSHRSEKPMHRREECLLVTTRESPCSAMKTQHNQK